MLCACIDIGTNTTRVLVAEASADGLARRREQRTFTGLGALQAPGVPLPTPVVAELARVVAAHCAFAEAAGARQVCIVATAAVRAAPDRAGLLAALTAATGRPIRLLDGDEEARLGFLGATRTLGRPLGGSVAVVDVGGGSTELAVGTQADGAAWTISRPIGSDTLTRACVEGDPPRPRELSEIRARTRDALAELPGLPDADAAVAVGGGAASLRRVLGDVLDPGSARRALARLCAAPALEVAGELGLESARVRLLPASILVLEAAAERLGLPLEIGSGGLREGVLMELAAGRLT